VGCAGRRNDDLERRGLALAAIGVHTAAMLAVTGLVAGGVCRGFDSGARLLRSSKRKQRSAAR
jgi:hypothetical protein